LIELANHLGWIDAGYVDGGFDQPFGKAMDTLMPIGPRDEISRYLRISGRNSANG
jgi:hypothetical protein